ncbi:MAG: glycosyltransferase family 39 protein [Pyrinomonadaceae bacterium]|nr:glycosyltransferase family 39 protein [Pyrinomonadaceae bacterium]
MSDGIQRRQQTRNFALAHMPNKRRNKAVAEATRPNTGVGLRADETRLVAMMLAIKALVFLYGGQSYQVLSDRGINGVYGWLELWNRWDALHYQKLAVHGYSAVGDMRPTMVFYPLFPWTIRLVAVVLNDYIVSALLISTLASVAAGILLYRLVQLDFSQTTASLAVWFLFIFPTSYFLHIGYTESLFLMLALGCVLAARTGRWIPAGLLGALACLTRATGLVLVPALVIEAGHQYLTYRKWNWRWLCVAIVPLGFGGYLFLNYHVAGDPFAFLPIRKDFYYISLAPPWTGLREAINSLNNSPAQAQIVGVQECLYIVLGFVCTIVSWIKLRPIYSVWMTGNWLLFTSVSFVASVPRYTLTMFPIFFLFAILAQRRLWLVIITVWSLLYLALFASLFAWGRWAF